MQEKENKMEKVMHVCTFGNEKENKTKNVWEGKKRGFWIKTKVFRKILICYLWRQVTGCFSPGVAEQAGGSTLR